MASRGYSIWLYALGYFACYAPYSALTKALSRGSLPGMTAPLDGFALLPVTTLASLVAMFAFLTVSGWWRYAGRRRVGGRELPWPSRWTFLSGIATGAVIATTTLAYTFDGVSIVFVMLLMRGGVLILAPIVDATSGRRVRWFSWVGLGLSLAALIVAFAEEGGYDITLLCAVDVAIYLAAYFVRLRFMSRLAKRDEGDASRRYFVEEQMVATPAIVLALALYALVGRGEIAAALRSGFGDVWASPALAAALLTGALSQGTGIFGGLVLLDSRENTYCVPVNRVSSILAGVLAGAGLSALDMGPPPSAYELAGAGLVVLAIAVLAAPSRPRQKR
ncbi:MAG TPA: hypothetical protein VIL20_24035 [Sandaracinaceae bacterium]